MSTANINFRTDAELKEQAERLFDEMGMNMTTALNVFLRATVRYGKIPFDLMGDDALLRERIHEKLMEAQAQASDPRTKYLSHNEMFRVLKEKHGIV